MKNSIFHPCGCIRCIDEVHAMYLDGRLSDDLCDQVDMHLFHCRCCENAWDARSSLLEDRLTGACDDDASEDDFGRATLSQLLSLQRNRSACA